MNAVDAGARLIALAEYAEFDAADAITFALTLAFRHPEYARALMEAAEGTDEDRDTVADMVRRFVEETPIEQHRDWGCG